MWPWTGLLSTGGRNSLCSFPHFLPLCLPSRPCSQRPPLPHDLLDQTDYLLMWLKCHPSDGIFSNRGVPSVGLSNNTCILPYLGYCRLLRVRPKMQPSLPSTLLSSTVGDAQEVSLTPPSPQRHLTLLWSRLHPPPDTLQPLACPPSLCPMSVHTAV